MATATLSEFRNEPYADFSDPANRQGMEAALVAYGGDAQREGKMFRRVNPGRANVVATIARPA